MSRGEWCQLLKHFFVKFGDKNIRKQKKIF